MIVAETHLLEGQLTRMTGVVEHLGRKIQLMLRRICSLRYLNGGHRNPLAREQVVLPKLAGSGVVHDHAGGLPQVGRFVRVGLEDSDHLGSRSASSADPRAPPVSSAPGDSHFCSRVSDPVQRFFSLTCHKKSDPVGGSKRLRARANESESAANAWANNFYSPGGFPARNTRSRRQHREIRAALLHHGLKQGVAGVAVELDVDAGGHVIGEIHELAPAGHGHEHGRGGGRPCVWLRKGRRPSTSRGNTTHTRLRAKSLLATMIAP